MRIAADRAGWPRSAKEARRRLKRYWQVKDKPIPKHFAKWPAKQVWAAWYTLVKSTEPRDPKATKLKAVRLGTS